MNLEHQQLTEKSIWVLIPRSDVPNGAQILTTLWDFKDKRYHDGRHAKFNLRIPAWGDIQRGVTHNNTYSPVVSWTTVRFLFVLTLILDISSRQIDFDNAFCQDPLVTPIYMHILRCFQLIDGQCEQDCCYFLYK